MKSRPSKIKRNDNFQFDSEKFNAWSKKNPKEWKKLKSKFDQGRLGFQCQYYNGIDIINENIIRSFLHDYNTRLLQYGLNVFPTTFNLLEPFFNFNHETAILELVQDEESYGLSLEDFLDHITSEKFIFSELNLYEEIPEEVIYNFTFTSGVNDYPFQCDDDTEYFIGHISLVRRNDDVTVLLHAGRKFDNSEIDTIMSSNYSKEYINESISLRKKQLGLKIEHDDKAKIVNYLGRDDLWLHLVAVKFDIKTKTIDIRYFGKDCNIIYEAFTDDFNAIALENKNGEIEEERLGIYINSLKELEKRNCIFEFAKYCMVLPNYVFQHEEKIVPVDYPTKLSEVIFGPMSRRKFRSVPLSIKVFAKPIYYLESPLTTVKKMRSVNDDSFHIEKSGYWKRLHPNEKGIDKYENEVIGKTWVERNETYYIEKEGVVNVKSSPIYNGQNSGLIYIMRQPGHHKNTFKVGLTKRTSEKRSKELSNTSVPDNFYVIIDYPVKDCIKAEKLIHQELSDFRISKRREFFHCDLKIIIKVCENIVTIINDAPNEV